MSWGLWTDEKYCLDVIELLSSLATKLLVPLTDDYVFYLFARIACINLSIMLDNQFSNSQTKNRSSNIDNIET